MTFETLNKSQRSFGLPVGFLMALYCLFNPSIIYVWLWLSFLGLTVDFYEYQLHVFYWWPLWQHSNRDSRKKEGNLCTSQHIKIFVLITHFHIPYILHVYFIFHSQPWGQVVFFMSKMWRHVYSRKHPFSDSFREVYRVLSRKDIAFSGGFRTKMSVLARFCGETGSRNRLMIKLISKVKLSSTTW